jgi:predicted metal-dependent peptidase
MAGKKFNDYELLLIVERLLREHVGYSEALCNMEKRISTSVKTASLSWDRERKHFIMSFNPHYMASQATDLHRMGSAAHESWHFLLRHWAVDMQSKTLNNSMDRSINCLIRPFQTGKDVWFPETPGLTTQALDRMTWEYYESLQPKPKDPQPGEDTDTDTDTDNGEDVCFVPMEDLPLADIAAKAAVERFVDAVARKPGNGSEEMLRALEAVWTVQIPWEQILKQFAGSHCRGNKSKTYTRHSRRFPGILRGTRKGFIPKVAVYLDVSGSVEDYLFRCIAGVVDQLTAIMEVTIHQFDMTVHPGEVYQRGDKVTTRKHTGGTSFQAVVDHAEDTRPDCIIICTDMGDYVPDTSTATVPRLWVTFEGADMQPAGTDTVITFPKLKD